MSSLTYLPDFLAGLWVTTTASFLSFAGGLLLGVLGALCRQSRMWLLRLIGTVYVEALRNTPALVQIFFIFFGLPALGIRLPAYQAGVIALSINAGAYLTEIIRAGLQAVPPGQIEAARALGLGHANVFSQVVFPQAFRLVYPPVVNQFIEVILGTSLLSTIALNELTGATLIVNAVTFETMQVFTVALVLYLILTNVVSFGAALLARVIFRPPLPMKKRVRGNKALEPLQLSGGEK